MFISESGVIKLGSVMPPITAYRSSSKRSTRNETMVHLAPEAFEGRLSLKSDIWALGISLIELADGRNPFYGFSGIQVCTVQRNDR